MPFQVGSVASHDDGQHIGSAKRATASGVASLNAGGHVEAPGDAIELTRDGANEIRLIEKTSGEELLKLIRYAANDCDAYVKRSGAYNQVMTSNMIDAANGIAGLSASVKLQQSESWNTGNALTGISPTLAGFSVNPTTDANITDETATTMTVNGQTSGAGTVSLLYDLGATYRISAGFLVAAISTHIDKTEIQLSTNGSNYYIAGTNKLINSTLSSVTAIGAARYIKFICDANAATSLNAIKCRVYKL